MTADGSLAMRARAAVGKASNVECTATRTRQQPVKFDAKKPPVPLHRNKQRLLSPPARRPGMEATQVAHVPFADLEHSPVVCVPQLGLSDIARTPDTMRSLCSTPGHTPRTLTDNALRKSQQLLKDLSKLDLWDDGAAKPAEELAEDEEQLEMPESPSSSRHMDMASSAASVTSDLLHAESRLLHSESAPMVAVPAEMVHMISELWEELRDARAQRASATRQPPSGVQSCTSAQDIRETARSLRKAGSESPLSNFASSSCCDSSSSTMLPGFPSPGASDASCEMYRASLAGSAQQSPRSGEVRRQLQPEFCACDVQLHVPGTPVLHRSVSMSSVAQSLLGTRSLGSTSHTTLRPVAPSSVVAPSSPRASLSRGGASSPRLAARLVAQQVEVRNVYEWVPSM